jgi:hypothetical protein
LLFIKQNPTKQTIFVRKAPIRPQSCTGPVTIRPNTLVTVTAGCIIVTSTFTFSPVATSFIRDRKDYLIDNDWPDSYRYIIK